MNLNHSTLSALEDGVEDFLTTRHFFENYRKTTKVHQGAILNPKTYLFQKSVAIFPPVFLISTKENNKITPKVPD